MPFREAIASKPPKFVRDEKSYNVTVKGPRHLFTPQVKNWLFLQGMNRINGQSTYEVWTTQYNIGAPALYVATYLDAKYGIILDADTRKMVDAAVQRHQVKDGFESILGIAPKPGDLALQIKAGSTMFIANCTTDNTARQDLLMGAGWLPMIKPNAKVAEAFGNMPFYTSDALLASNLEQIMVPAAKQHLKSLFAGFAKNNKLSNSQDVPASFDVTLPDRDEAMDYLPFQKAGIQMVINGGKGAIIADDMGLGKTI